MRCHFRELASDENVVRAAKEEVAGLGKADDQHGLLGRKGAFAFQQLFHHVRFFQADVLVGVGNAAEEVGKLRQVLGSRRFLPIERVQQIAKCALPVIAFVVRDFQPGAKQ